MEKETILFKQKNLPINVHRRNIENGKKYRDLHFHKAIEIVKINSGSIICDVAGEELTLGVERILVIAPGVVHRLRYYEDSANVTYMQIDIEECLKSFIPKKEDANLLFFIGISSKPYVFFDNSDFFSSVVSMTEAEYYNNDEYSENSLFSLMSLITAELCRKNMFKNLSELKKSKEISFLIPAMEYIEDNFKMKITLDTISAELHTDKFNFCKIFKSATGMTFVEYLNTRRLKNAERLLTRSTMSISDIAFECGFTSIQNFNHCFKKSKGVSPNSYRKMYY